MTEDSNTQELEALQADVDKAIAEAHDAVAEAEKAMSNIEALNQKLKASNGNLEELMPSKLYSEEERIAFVEALHQFVGDSKDWLSQGVKESNEAEVDKKQKTPKGNRKRGFSV